MLQAEKKNKIKQNSISPIFFVSRFLMSEDKKKKIK